MSQPTAVTFRARTDDLDLRFGTTGELCAHVVLLGILRAEQTR